MKISVQIMQGPNPLCCSTTLLSLCSCL
jgi:hypothetical protein